MIRSQIVVALVGAMSATAVFAQSTTAPPDSRIHQNTS